MNLIHRTGKISKDGIKSLEILLKTLYTFLNELKYRFVASYSKTHFSHQTVKISVKKWQTNKELA